MSAAAERWRKTWARAALAIFWLAALEFGLRSLDFPNDQFGRISPGRQILVHGELPFRDFLDPGYFLTEFSSAAMQWAFGQNLVGELLLNAVFIATGCLFVCLVMRRLAGGLMASIVAGLVALLAMPRAYDYDKVLFYPLCLWLALRWFEQPHRARLLALAVGLVVAAMYRYDNGVFLGLSVLIGVTVLYWGDGRRLVSRTGSLLLITACLSAPVLVFLQVNGGLVDAADQALSYGVRERDRTRISSAPRVHLGARLASINPPPPSENLVRVRWAPSATVPTERRQRAARLGLEDERPVGTEEGRTWLYTLPDGSFESVRRLVNDPQVEDTDGIDRGALRLSNPESRRLRLQRVSPIFRVRVLPDAWTFENAEALLYYLLMLLPVAGLLLVVARRREYGRHQRAAFAVVIALCVLLHVFILRAPINARVGGLAGPFAALAVAVAVTLMRGEWSRHRPRVRRVALAGTTGLLLLVLWSLSATVGWTRHVSIPFVHPLAISERLAAFATDPPSSDLLPSGRIKGIVDYVGDCIAPGERVFVSWFVPELFYFSQRGFGGAMAATFGSHWSEPRFQRHSIAALEAHSTPVAILRNGDFRQFQADYSLIEAYFARHYRLAGMTDFGDDEVEPDAYRVLVRTDRRPLGVDGRFGLPCFVERQHSL